MLLFLKKFIDEGDDFLKIDAFVFDEGGVMTAGEFKTLPVQHFISATAWGLDVMSLCLCFILQPHGRSVAMDLGDKFEYW